MPIDRVAWGARRRMEGDRDADSGDHGKRAVTENERQRIAQPKRHFGLLQDALERPRTPIGGELDAFAA